MIERWISIWDRREAPNALALVRICVGLALLVDFAQVGLLDLVEALWAPVQDGGIANVMGRKRIPSLYRWFPATASTAWTTWLVGLVASAMVTVGAGTRVACVVLAWVSISLGQVLTPTDRGIDMLLRNALVILALSGCHRVWSVDARIRFGRWRGDGSLVTAWPRFLLVIQLFIVYFTGCILILICLFYLHGSDLPSGAMFRPEQFRSGFLFRKYNIQESTHPEYPGISEPPGLGTHEIKRN